MRSLRLATLVWLGFLLLAPLLRAVGETRVSVLWARPGAVGRVVVDRGALTGLTANQGKAASPDFQLGAAGARLDLAVTPTVPQVPGGLPVLVTVQSAPRAFTFRLGDVSSECPICLPDDGIIITTADDRRSFDAILAAIRERGGRTQLQRIESAPEATFDSAAAASREVKVQTWLGVSRDMRLFWLDQNLEVVRPKLAGYDVRIPEFPKQPAAYAFQMGRGWGPRDTVSRRLDGGDLPILCGDVDDGAVHYALTAFASLERGTLTQSNLRGTDFLVADAYGHGHMFTPAQAEAEARIHQAELETGEEVVFCARVVATNRGAAPAYALLRTIAPTLATPTSPKLPAWSFDATNGFSRFESGRVFAVSRLNGRPLSAEEVSILLHPGESVELEFYLPNRPIPMERAAALAGRDMATRLEEARAFWREKLAGAARWTLPEARIDEMVRAGLLHLDLISYGREPSAPLLPAIGLYTAIGSESAPIIQFMDSMGWHETAARAIEFFLRKQHDDGFIQNFNGYMLETGAVLWTMGEHWRYTRDAAWLDRVHPHVTKACEYLLAWRERNQRPGLQDNGHGLLDGKTADPDDPYRSYMLNGYAYLGLARAAEMLSAAVPAEAARYRTAAAALKADIRAAVNEAMERSLVVPLGDGTWMRAAPPWTDYRGPVMLHADGGKWFTHGTMTARDSLLGPLYLVFQEIFDPRETVATELLLTHAELMTQDNVAFSQPYYSRHPWVHLRRGETKAFLQARYGAVASLADRHTYTFTEHFFPVSDHKTHEEAWFLMQTRWMLYLEEGEMLHLFSGLPRSYLRPGATVSLKGAASYFGPLDATATCSVDGTQVTVSVDCRGDRRPQIVRVRVPHPSGRPATSVEGADYSADEETAVIPAFNGHARLVLRY